MRAKHTTLFVAALGYAVDIFDTYLALALRVPILKEFGVNDRDLAFVGAMTNNAMLAGFLLGAVIFGRCADRYGRQPAMFASIAAYSGATLLTPLSSGVENYAILRFLSGLGLAGELTLGVALICELVAARRRMLVGMIVPTAGAIGLIAAASLSQLVTWRLAYLVGGLLGLSLLIFRRFAIESEVFESSRQALQGQFLGAKTSINSREMRTVFTCALAGLPIIIVPSLLSQFAPELVADGLSPDPYRVSDAMLFSAFGLLFGDPVWATLSHYFIRRKLIFICSILLTGAWLAWLFGTSSLPIKNINIAYWFIGFFAGIPATFLVFLTEQFRTEIRGFATSLSFNLTRVLGAFIATAFANVAPAIGPRNTAVLIGTVCLAVTWWATSSLKETAEIDLREQI